MAENLMNKNHKSTNAKYRDNYDRIFRKGRSIITKGYIDDEINKKIWEVAKANNFYRKTKCQEK